MKKIFFRLCLLLLITSFSTACTTDLTSLDTNTSQLTTTDSGDVPLSSNGATLAEEKDQARTEIFSYLPNGKLLVDYSSANQQTISSIKSLAISTLESALTIQGINNIVSATKQQINLLPTIADELAAALSDKKETAKSVINLYYPIGKIASNYTTQQKDLIASIKANAVRAIDNALTETGINQIVDNTKATIDLVEYGSSTLPETLPEIDKQTAINKITAFFALLNEHFYTPSTWQSLESLFQTTISQLNSASSGEMALIVINAQIAMMEKPLAQKVYADMIQAYLDNLDDYSAENQALIRENVEDFLEVAEAIILYELLDQLYSAFQEFFNELPIYVAPIIESVIINDKNRLRKTLAIGSQVKLEATVAPDSFSASWSSSNYSVLMVDALGQVSALAPGTATITASASNLSDSVVFEVIDMKLQAEVDFRFLTRGEGALDSTDFTNKNGPMSVTLADFNNAYHGLAQGSSVYVGSKGLIRLGTTLANGYFELNLTPTASVTKVVLSAYSLFPDSDASVVVNSESTYAVQRANDRKDTIIDVTNLTKLRIDSVSRVCFFAIAFYSGDTSGGGTIEPPPAGQLNTSAFYQSAAGQTYYATASGKTGTTLKTALHDKIKGHSSQSYASLWTYFQTTDKKANGKVWDMYSDLPGNPPYEFSYGGSDQCGTYSTENDCYNREHSFPKSWFNDATPMYTELFHLYPTDGYVNGRRSNYPFGYVTSATWTSRNGSKLGSGSSKNFGYTGTVFEPIDEYKGDFARTYFYMATRYQDVYSSWSGDMFENTPLFYKTWAKNVLLEWHLLDPVSEKEFNRNNAVYGIQGNRNPFIDNPNYIASIWQ